jgi:hypothetical protein
MKTRLPETLPSAIKSVKRSTFVMGVNVFREAVRAKKAGSRRPGHQVGAIPEGHRPRFG